MNLLITKKIKLLKYFFYSFNVYNRSLFKFYCFMQLRSFLNEIVIDQIPNLSALQRYLEQLSIAQLPAYKPELIIEQVPEIYDKLVITYKNKWKDIAKMQAKTVLNPSETEIRNQAKR